MTLDYAFIAIMFITGALVVLLAWAVVVAKTKRFEEKLATKVTAILKRLDGARCSNETDDQDP